MIERYLEGGQVPYSRRYRILFVRRTDQREGSMKSMFF